MVDFITVAHDDITGRARVPAHLEQHYADRGWRRVEPAGVDRDVQVVEPTDFEPAFIYGPDRDDPGDHPDNVATPDANEPSDAATPTATAAAAEQPPTTTEPESGTDQPDPQEG